MFSINVSDNSICLRDIQQEHLPDILSWYNKIDFKYATGIDTPITLEDLKQRYVKILNCEEEFFVGIYINNITLVGIINGKLHYQNKHAVWITSIVIDQAFQKKGCGKKAIELLLKHLKSNKQVRSVYLAVIEENIKGRIFWTRLKFQSLKRIDEHIKLLDKQRSVYIMYKKI